MKMPIQTGLCAVDFFKVIRNQDFSESNYDQKNTYLLLLSLPYLFLFRAPSEYFLNDHSKEQKNDKAKAACTYENYIRRQSKYSIVIL